MARKQHKYHYIYKTTCSVTGRYYIGMHSTSNLEDGYIGSGRRLWVSINKHGLENHTKEILEFLENRQLLKDRETQLVNNDLLMDPMCMNLQLGGGGGFSSTDHQHKCSMAGAMAIGRLEKSNKKFKELLSNPEYRKKHIEKIKLSRKNQPGNSAMLGKTHSSLTIEKMKKSHIGPNNSQYGTHWITDGTRNRKIKNTEYLPNGWVFGRSKE